MPVLSHLHHLFNAEQCQAYICTLRWKDRPLQCPRCQSHHIGQWGTSQYRQTLLVQRLQAHLQRPQQYPLAPEPAAAENSAGIFPRCGHRPAARHSVAARGLDRRMRIG
jgi:Transposase zinc-ribbon domain